MDIKNVFLVLSSVSSLSGFIIGIYLILKGEYKPHRITRINIFIVTTLFVLELIAKRDDIALFLACAQWIGGFIIFILSFKYGLGGSERSDVIVFILAMVSLVIWKTTNNPVLALYMSIFTDFIGLTPTLFKAYKQPFTEDPRFYLADVIAGLLNILALKEFNFNNVVFSGYIFCLNLLCIMIILISRRFKILSKNQKNHI